MSIIGTRLKKIEKKIQPRPEWYCFELRACDEDGRDVTLPIGGDLADADYFAANDVVYPTADYDEWRETLPEHTIILEWLGVSVTR